MLMAYGHIVGLSALYCPASTQPGAKRSEDVKSRRNLEVINEVPNEEDNTALEVIAGKHG